MALEKLISKVKGFFIKLAFKKAIGEKNMEKLMKFFEGKKTHFAALIGAILGLFEAYGIKVPEWVYIILVSFGFSALRDGISKAEKK